MGAMPTLSFKEHVIRREGHYKCQCGKRYTRVRKASWTENPFHEWRGRKAELDQERRAVCDAELQGLACPGCGVANIPTRIV